MQTHVVLLTPPYLNYALTLFLCPSKYFFPSFVILSNSSHRVFSVMCSCSYIQDFSSILCSFWDLCSVLIPPLPLVSSQSFTVFEVTQLSHTDAQTWLSQLATQLFFILWLPAWNLNQGDHSPIYLTLSQIESQLPRTTPQNSLKPLRSIRVQEEKLKIIPNMVRTS